MAKNIFRNKNGFTILEVLAAAAILSVSAYAGIAGYVNSMKAFGSLKNHQGLYQVEQNMVASANSPQAWQNTMTQNPQATVCLANSNCTAGMQAQPIALYDSNNMPLSTLSDSPASGFDHNGHSCGSYPSLQCPFRYEVSWQPVCAAGTPCTVPLVKVMGVLKTETTDIHQGRFDFVSYIPQPPKMTDFCLSMNGTVQPDGRCVLPLAKNCAVGKVAIGITASNDVTCGSVITDASYQCPAGQYMVGVYQSGTAHCIPQTVQPPPPAPPAPPDPPVGPCGGSACPCGGGGDGCGPDGY